MELEQDYTTILDEAFSTFTDKEVLSIKRGVVYESWSYSRFRDEIYSVASFLKDNHEVKGKSVIVIGKKAPNGLSHIMQ